MVPRNYRWEDLQRLVPQRRQSDADAICAAVRTRFAFLAECTADERALVDDQISHRERKLFDQLRTEARAWSPG